MVREVINNTFSESDRYYAGVKVHVQVINTNYVFLNESVLLGYFLYERKTLKANMSCVYLFQFL